VPILSGYPALPRGQVIKMHRKLESLPNILNDLRNADYQTAFYYGGDINFANLKSYLLMGKVGRLVTMQNFPDSTYNAKWGVHDHIMFERLLTDLRSAAEPFFYVFLTLSSHEPFDVPGPPVCDTSTKDGKFINSVFYTDKCLGDFIRVSRHEKWWNNTLVVLLADHGVRMIGRSPNYAPEKFKIPMLWLGGALNLKGEQIEAFASQNDLAIMLLHQLGLDARAYPFSKDVLSAGIFPYAFYTFNDGFGFLTEKSQAVYNNHSQSFILLEPKESREVADWGKAYLQILSQDFLRR
jgi:phosphoglycerol transferase MdoB-like AlkP superfamily enzyme